MGSGTRSHIPRWLTGDKVSALLRAPTFVLGFPVHLTLLAVTIYMLASSFLIGSEHVPAVRVSLRVDVVDLITRPLKRACHIAGGWAKVIRRIPYRLFKLLG